MLKLPMLVVCSLGVSLAQSGVVLAQDVRHINPPGVTASPAYSQVVTAKPGTVVWVAGQIAQNAKGELVGKGDLKAQAHQVWETVRVALEALPPAATLVGVQSLASEDWLVEIEVTAVIK